MKWHEGTTDHGSDMYRTAGAGRDPQHCRDPGSIPLRRWHDQPFVFQQVDEHRVHAVHAQLVQVVCIAEMQAVIQRYPSYGYPPRSDPERHRLLPNSCVGWWQARRHATWTSLLRAIWTTSNISLTTAT